MSDEHLNHEVEFEQEDLRAKPIIWFMVALAVILFAVYLLMHGLYSGLNRYELNKAEKSEQNPLVTTTADPEQRRETAYKPTHAEIEKIFADPRLEENEREELKDVILKQEETLHRYEYVDESAGIVRIPIERAMQLIAQRGLPTRPQTDAAAPAAKPGAPAKK